ncbi:hypothetical protein pb186bvf_012259 [Paramecium bursaria]
MSQAQSNRQSTGFYIKTNFYPNQFHFQLCLLKYWLFSIFKQSFLLFFLINDKTILIIRYATFNLLLHLRFIYLNILIQWIDAQISEQGLCYSHNVQTTYYNQLKQQSLIWIPMIFQSSLIMFNYPSKTQYLLTRCLYKVEYQSICFLYLIQYIIQNIFKCSYVQFSISYYCITN